MSFATVLQFMSAKTKWTHSQFSTNSAASCGLLDSISHSSMSPTAIATEILEIGQIASDTRL